MRRELRYGVAALRGRPLVSLVAWSVPEALPAAVSGLTVAHAVDDGFLAGRPTVGLAWLGVLMLACCVGAAGSRQVYRHLGDIVEPMRDDLVRRVVGGALRRGVAGRPDDGALARLTRQVETVRDTYAGLVVVLRGFVVTVAGALVGSLAVAPVVALLVGTPFLVGVGLFTTALGMAAARYRASVLADERLAVVAGEVLAGTRDAVARGAEEHAATLVAGPVAEQAAAERALIPVTALRIACFAIGGWLPLVVLLAAGPALVRGGLTTGALMGGLTYVLMGLQPALNQLVTGLGGGGLRFVVTLGRVLDASAPDATGQGCPVDQPAAAAAGGCAPPAAGMPNGHDIVLRRVTFAYGPHAEPVLRDLDLILPAGDHLAVVGQSGIGKSTFANVLCGLLRPDAGSVLQGGVPLAGRPADRLAAQRVLIPQQAYVFEASLWENLTYLRPAATVAEVDHAIAAIGADASVARLGGLSARLHPPRLSAGERQLIALVRAYLSAAPVAVLDEATCHLDPAAERNAEQAFADRGGTLVVIAHRMSSALRARRILVLDSGHAVLGDHMKLLVTSPLYRDLLGYWQASTATGHIIRPR